MRAEWLSSIEPEEYDEIIYPQLVMSWMVGQKDMYTDDILLSPNPEKVTPPKREEPCEVKPERHPLQGEFILCKRIDMKGFKVASYPKND